MNTGEVISSSLCSLNLDDNRHSRCDELEAQEAMLVVATLNRVGPRSISLSYLMF